MRVSHLVTADASDAINSDSSRLEHRRGIAPPTKAPFYALRHRLIRDSNDSSVWPIAWTGGLLVRPRGADAIV